MSKANRKMMYDKLVSEKRYSHIDQSLIDEFGDPMKKPKEKPKEKPKKAVKKSLKKQTYNYAGVKK